MASCQFNVSFIGENEVDEMPLDEMPQDEMPLVGMPLDELPQDEMPLDVNGVWFSKSNVFTLFNFFPTCQYTGRGVQAFCSSVLALNKVVFLSLTKIFCTS